MAEDIVKEISNKASIKTLIIIFIIIVIFIVFKINFIYICLYYLGYIIIKSLCSIGISKNDADKTILILLNLHQTKENDDFCAIMKKDMQELIQDKFSIKVNIIRDTNLLYKLSSTCIRILYNYRYIIKMEVINTSEEGKKIKILDSTVDFYIKGNDKIEEYIKKDYKKICEGNNKIIDDDQLNGIKEYNKLILPMLQFAIAILLPIIDEDKLEETEIMLLQLLKIEKKEFIEIKAKKLIGIINYIKYRKIYNSKLIYNEKELREMENFLTKYNNYYGRTFDYYNSIAIIYFLQRKNKNIIRRNLDNAKRISYNKSQKILVELNLAFVYMFFRKYEKSIAKYRYTFETIETIDEENLKEEIKQILNEIQDFINNLPYNGITSLEATLATIYINAKDKETSQLALDMFHGLANNSKYINLPSKVRNNYEKNVKKLLYKNVENQLL